MATGKSDPPKLDPDEILVSEFGYITQTAFQTNEDRSRVLSFYMVTIGSLLGAILGVRSDGSSGVYLAFGGLFVLLSIFGILTLLQLVRLRQAWFEAAIAMNKIKDYYISQYKDLTKAITWRTNKEPARINFWSIGYLQALQVSLLGGVTAGAAAFCFNSARTLPGYLSPTQAGLLAGSIFFVLQMMVYHYRLRTSKQ